MLKKSEWLGMFIMLLHDSGKFPQLDLDDILWITDFYHSGDSTPQQVVKFILTGGEDLPLPTGIIYSILGKRLYIEGIHKVLSETNLFDNNKIESVMHMAEGFWENKLSIWEAVKNMIIFEDMMEPYLPMNVLTELTGEDDLEIVLEHDEKPYTLNAGNMEGLKNEQL